MLVRFTSTLMLATLLGAGSALAQQDPNWGPCGMQGSYSREQQRDGCTALINSGRETTENLAIAYSNRGNARRALGDLAGALSDQDQSLRLNPNYLDGYYNRALARNAAGDYAGAIADYDQVLRLNPRDHEALNNRGNVYLAQNNDQRALQDYDAAIAIDATNYRAWRNRGLIYFRAGDDQRAIQDYTQAIRVEPQFADAYLSRGNAFYRRRDYTSAIADYDLAESLWQDGYALYGRGVARLRLGQVAEGQADIANATARHPNAAAEFAAAGVAP